MSGPTDRTLTADGVTEETAKALRAAMQRLFAGKPQRTDGRLTKQNLWQEAGVSRATMNRAHSILTEWDEHLARHGSATPGEARRDEDIRELRRKLTEKTRECTTLQRRLDAAATAIAALHHDNTLLRQEISASGGRVISLHRPRGPADGDVH
ncbi:hypothetical protein OG749_17945 [Streptomyces nojiriensis]|uniref:hypothetical protein n=1 Tax=Streptomyces nojiriensis TaxID=66374 RepID=UPI002E174BD2